MKILFKDIDEFRACVPWLYKTAEFERFVLDIELATEDLIEVVGERVYDRALKAYEDGTGEELVRCWQLPVALSAYLSYCANGDVSHEADGRKVKIDKESESLPWQWMIDQDNAAIRSKVGKATDRLIAFLDKHVDKIEEWKESEQRKGMNELFVKSAAEFDEVVPIDRSRFFFLRVLPFVRAVDRDMIKYVGREKFAGLKAAMREGALTVEQERLVELCREIVPHLVMAKAVRRLAVQVLPDSVVTRFAASSQTQAASVPVSADLISVMENVYTGDANRGIVELQEYIQEISPVDDSYERRETDYRQEKFFSV